MMGPNRIQRRCAGENCLTLVSGSKYCLKCRDKRDKARRAAYDVARKNEVTERESIESEGA